MKQRGIFLMLIACRALVAEAEIYTSVQDISDAFLLERRVVNALQSYVYKTEQKLSRIKRYLTNYQHVFGLNHKQVESDEVFAEDAAGNPIHVFQLIRRLTVDWKKIEQNDPVTDWQEVEEALLQSCEGRRTKLPREEDLQGAAQALVRLQSIYHLNTSSLARGSIQGMDSVAELRAQDCLYMGKHSFNMAMYSNAIEWFEEAYTLAGLERNLTLTQDQVMGFLNTAIRALHVENSGNEDSNTFAPLADRSSNLGLGIDSAHTTTNNYKLGVDISTVDDVTNFEALCRGEKLVSEAYKSTLKCYISSVGSNYYLLRPVKIEFQFHNPQIIIFHDVISDEEIKTLKTLARPQLSRAMVQAGTWAGGKVSNTRTSKVAWLDDDIHPVITRLNWRISALTRLIAKSKGDTSELLQVANYGIGGFYNPHYDYFFAEHTTNPIELEAGDRLATFMFYLSDVAQGGATAFPKIGVSLWPKKGTAAFWYNLKPSGEGNPATLHGACPVIIGSKWVSNKWIRERQQFLASPCPLSKNVWHRYPIH